eukprot:jgi/Botrbrau1/8856/Bobra.50_2s0013.1
MANLFSDPDLMKAAMDQMKRMTPDQMASIQKQMADLPPDLLKQQMDMMGSMSPDMLKKQMEMMKQLPPEQLESMKAEVDRLGPAGMAQKVKQVQDYQMSGSTQLKAEGNTLTKEQKYEEALEKYGRAITNLEGISTAPAKDIRKACQLNSCMCYLKLGQFNKCIEEAGKVLSQDPRNMKAFYRRGDAYLSVGRFREAVMDLTAALTIAPAGERELIKERLLTATKGIEPGGFGAASGAVSQDAGRGSLTFSGGPGLKDGEAEAEPTTSTQGQASSKSEADAGTVSNETDFMAKVLEDPAMKNMMMSMVRGMDSETLSKMTGMPADKAKESMERLKELSDDQLEQMLKVSQSMQNMMKKTKRVLNSRWFWILVFAVLFLIIAVIVRYFVAR